MSKEIRSSNAKSLETGCSGEGVAFQFSGFGFRASLDIRASTFVLFRLDLCDPSVSSVVNPLLARSEGRRYDVCFSPASRNRNDGASTVTIVFGGTLLCRFTPAPTTDPAPTTVSPPRIVALA